MRAAEVVLTDEQRATLRGWLGAGKTERRLAFRAEVILAIAEGLSNEAVAERLGTRPATVSKWRGRLCAGGFVGSAGRVAQRQAQAVPGRARAADPGGFGRAAADGVRALGRPLVGPASGRHLQTSDLAGSAPA